MSAGTATTTLVLAHVSRRFRRGAETVVAVDDASLELTAGSFTVVSGPSGSGKTSLLNIVVGWDVADEGVIEPTIRPTDWSALAVIPQRLGLIEYITVAENVSLPGRAGTLHLDPHEIMATLRIDHLADRFPGETSLGEQQRAACARALVSRPALLVADEPTSHQDAANTERIVAELVGAAAQGCAVLVATHDPRVVTRATNRYAISDGRLSPDDPPSDPVDRSRVPAG